MTMPSFDSSQPIFIIKSGGVAIIVLAVFATAIAPFIDEAQRNFLVIGLSSVMPLLLIAFRLPVSRELRWVGAVAIYMLLLPLFNEAALDLSTVSYTILLIFPYLFIVGCLGQEKIIRQKVSRFLRWLILAFGLVSIVQFLAAYAGFWVPNQILSKGIFSHNSLAVEPSHLARVLCISILVYLALCRMDCDAGVSPFRVLAKEWIVVAAFLTSSFLSGSALAAMAAPLALILAFKARWTMLSVGLFVLLVPLTQDIQIQAIQRLWGIAAALPSMDIYTIANSDHSGAVRIMPALVYLSEIELDASVFWFGSGPSSIRDFFAGRLPGVADGFEAGFFPGFGIAFGVVGFALMVVVFILRFVHKKTLPFVVFWFAIFFSSPWNSQLFWYGLMMLRILYHFEVEAKEKVGFRTLRLANLG